MGFRNLLHRGLVLAGLLAVGCMDGWTFVPIDGGTDVRVDTVPPVDVAGDTSTCGFGLTLCGARCVNLATEPEHCGACDRACMVAHASTLCRGGACVMVACEMGHADCDTTHPDGCETDTRTAVAHCGACDHDCRRLAHVQPTATGVACTAGRCVVPAAACERGWTHCSSNPDDGCETSLASPAHCGACGRRCVDPTPTCLEVSGMPGTWACT